MTSSAAPILLIGMGSIGQRHLRNLASISDRPLIALRSGRSTLPTQELPALQITGDLSAAIRTHQPAAVFICHPTAYHLPSALEAAKAGCALFIEKPVSHQLEGIEELQNIVEQNQVKAQVGFHFRFHPVLQQIKKLLEEGSLGRVISAHVHWGEYLPDWHPWEDYRQSYSARADQGGGVVLTLCHPFDYLRWLLGKVTQVFASGGQLSPLELNVEDTAMIQLTFENQTIGSVYLDYFEKPPRHQMILIGEKGKVEWDGLSGTAKIYYHEQAAAQTLNLPDHFTRNDLFLQEVRSFMSYLSAERPSPCSLADGIAALQIAIAVKSSIQTGQPVLLTSSQLSLPIIPSL